MGVTASHFCYNCFPSFLPPPRCSPLLTSTLRPLCAFTTELPVYTCLSSVTPGERPYTSFSDFIQLNEVSDNDQWHFWVAFQRHRYTIRIPAGDWQPPTEGYRDFTRSLSPTIWMVPSYSAELRAGRSGVRVPARAENFSSRPDLGPTQPPNQWVPGSLSLGIKRPGREAYHLPPSSAKVEAWVYTSTPPIRLYGAVLKAQGQLYFTLLYFIWASNAFTSTPLHCVLMLFQ
jgi:hypothetical protein